MDYTILDNAVLKYRNKLQRYVYKMNIVPYIFIKDVVGDAILNAYIKFKTFDKNKNINTWLFTITRNQAIDYWRKNHKIYRNQIPENYEEKEYLNKDSLIEYSYREFENKDSLNRLLVLVDKLSIKYSEPIKLRYINSYSCEEISIKLNISNELVRQRLFLGLRKLHKIIIKK